MKVQFEGVQHYVDRLFDQAIIKAVISFIGSGLTILFGEVTAPVIGFLFGRGSADYITGVAKSFKKGTLSSWVFQKRRLGKIASYAVVIFMGHS